MLISKLKEDEKTFVKKEDDKVENKPEAVAEDTDIPHIVIEDEEVAPFETEKNPLMEM